jgi:hypothetical protein
VTIFPLKRVFPIPRRAQRERVRNNVRRLSTRPNGPENATIPRGGKAKSRVQRSRRATRLGVLREVRQHTELEIEFVRRDVFVALRVEVHGKRTGDFRENARAIARSRDDVERVALWCNLVEKECVRVAERARERLLGVRISPESVSVGRKTRRRERDIRWCWNCGVRFVNAARVVSFIPSYYCVRIVVIRSSSSLSLSLSLDLRFS